MGWILLLSFLCEIMQFVRVQLERENGNLNCTVSSNLSVMFLIGWFIKTTKLHAEHFSLHKQTTGLPQEHYIIFKNRTRLFVPLQ